MLNKQEENHYVFVYLKESAFGIKFNIIFLKNTYAYVHIYVSVYLFYCYYQEIFIISDGKT